MYAIKLVNTFILMLKWIRNFIGKIIYNRNENVFFYFLPMAAEKETGEKLKVEILNFISKNKKIEYSDFITDYTNGLTYFVFATEEQSHFFTPIFYQIYAYTKLKDMSKFTYSYKTLIFKETTIIKFKVKCYGKKQ